MRVALAALDLRACLKRTTQPLSLLDYTAVGSNHAAKRGSLNASSTNHCMGAEHSYFRSPPTVSATDGSVYPSLQCRNVGLLL